MPLSGDVSSRRGLGDLKSRARALDANTILLLAESVSVTNAGREIDGQAYRCPPRGHVR